MVVCALLVFFFQSRFYERQDYGGKEAVQWEKLIHLARSGLSREIREVIYNATGIDRTKPTIIRVSLTERCNYRCIYCYHWRRESYSTELNAQEWSTIFGSLGELNDKSIIQFSGGEPFLRKDFLEIVAEAKGAGFQWGAITNGYRLGEKECEKICELEPLNLDISLDSACAQTHDRARGIPGSFARVTNGISRLVRLKEQCGKQFSIRIKCTVHMNNYCDLSDLVDLTKFLGATSVDFSPVRFEDTLNQDLLYVRQENLEELREQISIIKEKKARGDPIETSDAKLDSMPDHFLRKYVQHGLKSCHASLRDLAIGANGEAAFCGSYPSLGKLTDTSAKDVWRGQESTLMRRGATKCEKFGSQGCANSCLTHRTFRDNVRRALHHLNSK